MKSRRILLLIVLVSSTVLAACGTTKYYHSTVINANQSGSEAYIELQLLKDGSFNEYIYFGLNDSIYNANEGIRITGKYLQTKDTLFLTYSSAQNLKLVETDATVYKETYLITDEGLVLLDPITYSYHLLNRKMVLGQSAKLRSLPHYTSINWVQEVVN